MIQNNCNTYKRRTREVPQDVRDKIAASLRGVKKTPEHRKNISKGLRADTGGYWSHIPSKPSDPVSSGDVV